MKKFIKVALTMVVAFGIGFGIAKVQKYFENIHMKHILEQYDVQE